MSTAPWNKQYIIYQKIKTNMILQGNAIFMTILEIWMSHFQQSLQEFKTNWPSDWYHKLQPNYTLSFAFFLFLDTRYEWIFTGLYFTSENYSLAQVSTWARNSCTFLFTWKHRQLWYLRIQFLPIKGYCTR